MAMQSIWTNLGLLVRKNRYILGDRDRPAQQGQVNVDWWLLSELGVNLGDALSPVVVGEMLSRHGIAADEPVGRTAFLAAVGSVLGMGFNDSVVWGSGLLDVRAPKLLRPRVKRLDIRAVRGPRTASELRARGYDCPNVFGDPAVLLPLFYQPQDAGVRRDVLYASHIRDRALFPAEAFSLQTDDYRAYVDAVVASELVVTSSLHAIIIAECYGVPAVLVSSERLGFSSFKFEDWYLSTGRSSFPVAASVEEAATLDPPSLPEVGPLQEALIESFPYDMWGRAR